MTGDFLDIFFCSAKNCTKVQKVKKWHKKCIKMQKLSMGDIIILVVISALADRVGASRKGDFF